MKVKTLRDLIKDLPDDMEIKMSIDPEGNRFYSLSAAYVDHWNKNINEPMYEEYGEDIKGLPEVVVLWP